MQNKNMYAFAGENSTETIAEIKPTRNLQKKNKSVPFLFRDDDDRGLCLGFFRVFGFCVRNERARGMGFVVFERR